MKTEAVEATEVAEQVEVTEVTEELPPMPGSEGWVEVEPLEVATDEMSDEIAKTEIIVTMAAARVALRRSGKITVITEALKKMGGEAQDIWDYSTHVSESSPLIKAIVENPEIGIDEPMIKGLFQLAIEVQAEIDG